MKLNKCVSSSGSKLRAFIFQLFFLTKQPRTSFSREGFTFYWAYALKLECLWVWAFGLVKWLQESQHKCSVLERWLICFFFSTTLKLTPVFKVKYIRIHWNLQLCSSVYFPLFQGTQNNCVFWTMEDIMTLRLASCSQTSCCQRRRPTLHKQAMSHLLPPSDDDDDAALIFLSTSSQPLLFFSSMCSLSCVFDLEKQQQVSGWCCTMPHMLSSDQQKQVSHADGINDRCAGLRHAFIDAQNAVMSPC